MPTRSVTLSESEFDLVESLVETGRYQSAEEVVGEALHLLENHETTDDATKIARLRAEIQIGVDALERGDYLEFNSVDALVSYLRQLGDEIIYYKGEG